MHAFKQCRRALQLQGWHVEWALEFLFKMDTLHGCSSECEKRNACAMRILSICRGEFNLFLRKCNNRNSTFEYAFVFFYITSG